MYESTGLIARIQTASNDRTTLESTSPRSEALPNVFKSPIHLFK